MITINKEKMSKSKGNIKSVDLVLQNWGPNIIRLFCLAGHYSKPIDYSEELFKENVVKWRQVESAYYEIILAQSEGPTEEIKKIISECQNEFNSAMDNDLNTHLALSAFFKLVKEINRFASEETLTKSIAEIAQEPFEKMLHILGLNIPKMTEEEKNSINDLIEKREKLRKEKQFEEADKIRAQISEMGIELIDHKNRTTWRKNEKINSE